MKKFIFAVSILSLSCLFGQVGVQVSKKTQVKSPDEIELLVNDLLLEKRAPVRYQHVQESMIKEGKYFVQMAAYSRLKPVKLISQLESKGYSTAINQVWRDNKKVNLVLVGPYKSRAEVQKYLYALKSVEKGAFIYVSK